MRIKVKGISDTKNAIQKVQIDIVKELDTKGIESLAEDVYTLSQQSVPVDTGKLRDSGDIRKVDNAIRVEYNTPYARKINYLHKSKPFFLTRAFTIVSDRSKGIIKSILSKKL